MLNYFFIEKTNKHCFCLTKTTRKKIEFKFFIKKELSKTYRFYKILCLIPGKSFQYMYFKISLVQKSFKANNSQINYQLLKKSQIRRSSNFFYEELKLFSIDTSNLLYTT